MSSRCRSTSTLSSSRLGRLDLLAPFEPSWECFKGFRFRVWGLVCWGLYPIYGWNSQTGSQLKFQGVFCTLGSKPALYLMSKELRYYGVRGGAIFPFFTIFWGYLTLTEHFLHSKMGAWIFSVFLRGLRILCCGCTREYYEAPWVFVIQGSK